VGVKAVKETFLQRMHYTPVNPEYLFESKYLHLTTFKFRLVSFMRMG